MGRCQQKSSEIVITQFEVDGLGRTTKRPARRATSTAPKARVSYVANYYDLADRRTDTANVGTNAGTAYTRPGSVPSRSDTVLVSSQAYNSAGWVATTTDPRGIVNDVFYDNLGRTTKTIEA